MDAYATQTSENGTAWTQCTETEGVPYRRGAKAQPITTHGVHADDVGGTYVVGSGLK